jgi:hypothetical protein
MVASNPIRHQGPKSPKPRLRNPPAIAPGAISWGGPVAWPRPSPRSTGLRLARRVLGLDSGLARGT